MGTYEEQIKDRLTFEVTPLPALRAAVRAIIERPLQLKIVASHNGGRAMKEAVLKAIEGERAYQERRWGKDDETNPKPVASHLIWMRHWMRVAEEAATKDGDHTALDAIRKITSLGVSCMESHGAPTREQEEARK